MSNAMSGHEMRGARSHAVALHRFDNRCDYSRVRGQTKIIVAAESEVFPPVNPDARALRAFQRKAISHQSGTAQLFQLCGKALKAHMGSSPSIPV